MVRKALIVFTLLLVAAFCFVASAQDPLGYHSAHRPTGREAAVAVAAVAEEEEAVAVAAAAEEEMVVAAAATNEVTTHQAQATTTTRTGTTTAAVGGAATVATGEIATAAAKVAPGLAIASLAPPIHRDHEAELIY
uniref:Uncharacterized protein n=1 Tax=Oryza barthii TaxID=65489 RepID=A0A0D3F6Z6_9ORYZ